MLSKTISIFILLFMLTACIVQPSQKAFDPITYQYKYKPVPLNRERGGISYFNLHGIQKIRVVGLPVEIIKSHKQELEAQSNYMRYLRVLRYQDELLLLYEFPGTGPDSGLHRMQHHLKIHTNQPIIGLATEEAGRITVRDLLFTPQLFIEMNEGNIKCDVNTSRFQLTANRASTFSGWVEAQDAQVFLKNAAVATVGGSIENIRIFADHAAVFDGRNLQGINITATAQQRSKIRTIVKGELTAHASQQAEILFRPISNPVIRRNAQDNAVISSY